MFYLSKLTQHQESSDSPLANIPPELQNKLFSYLDLVTSTCLGLTSKKLYAIHKSYHSDATITLFSQTDFFGSGTRVKRFCLVQLLEDWIRGKISPWTLANCLRTAEFYEKSEQSRLKLWVKIFSGYTKEVLCKRPLVPHVARVIQEEAKKIVLVCSMDDTEAFWREE